MTYKAYPSFLVLGLYRQKWTRFLKTGEIENTDTAKGVPEARERLRIAPLNETEKQAYYRDMEAIRYQKSVISTG